MSRSRKSSKQSAPKPASAPKSAAPAPARSPSPRQDRPEATSSTPLLDEAEHTLFVNGTWSGSDGDYWNDGVEQKANNLLGSQSSEEFDWYGGPNDKRSRRIAGRKLLREGVTPAFERGETVNLVSHSHGGNVVGEMTAALDARLDYLGALEEGLSAPLGSEAHARAMQVLEERLASLEGERASIEATAQQTNELELDKDFDHARAQAEILAELDAEIAETLAHHATVSSGGAGLDIMKERRVLEDGEFGDALLINTPFLDAHANPLDSSAFGERVDNVYDFNNVSDKVVLGAQSHQCNQDEAAKGTPQAEAINLCATPNIPSLTTDREGHPNASKVTTNTWKREEGEGIGFFDDQEQFMKQDHNLPVIDGDVFDRVIKSTVEGRKS